MQRNRADILGSLVDEVDYDQAMKAITAFVAGRQGALIITANAEIIYQASEMPEYREMINQAELVTPDGIGTVWAGRHLGYSFRERVTGIDLIFKICAEAIYRGWSLYLLGAAPGVAERAAGVLRQSYPGLIICGTRDGFFKPDEEADVVTEITSAQPDILLVAMGAPRQEMWISCHREELGVPVYMGGGRQLRCNFGSEEESSSVDNPSPFGMVFPLAAGAFAVETADIPAPFCYNGAQGRPVHRQMSCWNQAEA